MRKILAVLSACFTLAAGSIVWKDKLYQPITSVDLEASQVRELLLESGRISPHLVMDYLSRTKNKEATLLQLWPNGQSYTINDLVKLNDVTLESCSQEALKERVGVCRKLMAAQVPDEEKRIRLNLVFLCRRSLEDLAEMCASRGGHDRSKFLWDLSEKWRSFVVKERRLKPRLSEDLYVDQLSEFERFITNYQS